MIRHDKTTVNPVSGVTQGDPLSPFIFNIAVDAVVRELRARFPLGDLFMLFYADNGWLASYWPEVLQQAVDTVTDLFWRMGLKMNADKTKTMSSHPGNAFHSIVSPAYDRRQTGEGLTYSARKRQKVDCPKCGKSMQEQSLANHRLKKHNFYERPHKRRRLLDTFAVGSVTYRVEYDSKGIVQCPVPGCDGRANNCDNLRRHFVSRHPHDMVHTTKEGLLPRCELCHMQVQDPMSLRHVTSQRCKVGAERKRKRDLELANERAEGISFSVDGTALEQVDGFRYLGRQLVVTGNDWPAVVSNLAKVRALGSSVKYSYETPCQSQTRWIFLQSSRPICAFIWLRILGDLSTDPLIS
jgi:Reverse transcriptase (RNA-dependent DNA polymerase)